MGEGEGVAGRPGEGTNLLKREVKLLGDVLLQHADQHQVHEVEAPPQLQSDTRGESESDGGPARKGRGAMFGSIWIHAYPGKAEDAPRKRCFLGGIVVRES